MSPLSPEIVAFLVGLALIALLLFVVVAGGLILYRRKSQSIPSYVDSLVASHRRRIAINDFLADAIEENDIPEKP